MAVDHSEAMEGPGRPAGIQAVGGNGSGCKGYSSAHGRELLSLFGAARVLEARKHRALAIIGLHQKDASDTGRLSFPNRETGHFGSCFAH
jgi:hypothetical protein